MTSVDRAAVRNNLELVDAYVMKLHSLVAVLQNGRASPRESQVCVYLRYQFYVPALARVACECLLVLHSV